LDIVLFLPIRHKRKAKAIIAGRQADAIEMTGNEKTALLSSHNSSEMLGILSAISTGRRSWIEESGAFSGCALTYPFYFQGVARRPK
jgi:hypothetical protein